MGPSLKSTIYDATDQNKCFGDIVCKPFWDDLLGNDSCQWHKQQGRKGHDDWLESAAFV